MDHYKLGRHLKNNVDREVYFQNLKNNEGDNTTHMTSIRTCYMLSKISGPYESQIGFLET